MIPEIGGPAGGGRQKGGEYNIKSHFIVTFVVATLALIGSLFVSTSGVGQEPTPTATSSTAEFFGSVTFRDEPVADGTRIEALMGPDLTVCGSTTTNGGIYRISVTACGGDTEGLVFFRSAANKLLAALEHGDFVSGTAQELNLRLTSPSIFGAAAFIGTVTINGIPAADDTLIEALIGDIVCGTTTTSDGRYSISISIGYGFGSAFEEGCGDSGPGTNTVVFRSAPLIANETGNFIGHLAQELDLSFGKAPEPPPPSELPDTGSGSDSQSEISIAASLFLWLLVSLGLAALGAGLTERRSCD